MLNWIPEKGAHRATIGLFDLVVWPGLGPSGGAGPYQAWISISAAGNTEGLPHHEGFPTVEKAKTWIEREFRRLLEGHLRLLDGDT